MSETEINHIKKMLEQAQPRDIRYNPVEWCHKLLRHIKAIESDCDRWEKDWIDAIVNLKLVNDKLETAYKLMKVETETVTKLANELEKANISIGNLEERLQMQIGRTFNVEGYHEKIHKANKKRLREANKVIDAAELLVSEGDVEPFLPLLKAYREVK